MRLYVYAERQNLKQADVFQLANTVGFTYSLDIVPNCHIFLTSRIKLDYNSNI